MSERKDGCAGNTFSESILYEFTSTESRPLDEARREPRFGGPPPEVLEERAREAARIREEEERNARPPENGSSDGNQK